jgi:hypothetical protein
MFNFDGYTWLSRSDSFLSSIAGTGKASSYAFTIQRSSTAVAYALSIGTLASYKLIAAYLYGQRTQVDAYISGPTSVGSNLANNSPHNVVMTIGTGGTTKYYIDGSLASPNGTQGPYAYNTTLNGTLRVGGRFDGYYLNGSLGNVAIWNSELSATVANAITTTPANIGSYSPLAWWKLSSGTDLLDYSGNHYDLTNNALPPSVPAYLSVSTGSSPIVLSWPVTARAASYGIYGSSDGGLTYTLFDAVTPGSVTSYTDSSFGLTPHKTYFYGVTADNMWGESGKAIGSGYISPPLVSRRRRMMAGANS